MAMKVKIATTKFNETGMSINFIEYRAIFHLSTYRIMSITASKISTRLGESIAEASKKMLISLFLLLIITIITFTMN